MKKKTKTDRIVKTVLGGAAGGAICQVVKGTIMKGKSSLYTDLGAIAVGCDPSFPCEDGRYRRIGRWHDRAGAAGVIGKARSPRWPVLRSAGSIMPCTVRVRLIAKTLSARVKKKIKTAS